MRACLRQPVDQTPVWFLRQAGRYMPEYQAVRRHHSLLEICKNPELAAEVTITAAEKLDVDAAIIFADLLLPLEGMGLDFEFLAGEGPVIHHPVRTADDVENLRIDRAHELGYVAEAIRKVVAHFQDRIGIVGFCGAPFTLASYMIEGGGSRNYIYTKSLMYREPSVWQLLLEKLASVLAEYAAQQVEAGADVIQIFDSWAGALSPADYRDFVLPVTTRLVRKVQALGVPVIYFGVDTATLLPAMRETGADVIGLDWRVPLDQGWSALGHAVAVQGNLDPITLFAGEDLLRERVRQILAQAGGRPGHIFNLGHGIVPGTPVENVQRVVQYVREFSAVPPEAIPMPDIAPQRHAVLLLAHGTPAVPRPDSRIPAQCHRRAAHARIRGRRDSSPLQSHWVEPADRAHPGARAPALRGARVFRSMWACATGSRTSPTWCARCVRMALPRRWLSVLRHRTPAPAWDSIAAPPLPKPRAPSRWTSSTAGPTIPSLPRPLPNACSRSGKVSLRASVPWRRCSLPPTASPAEPSRCSLRLPQASPIQDRIPVPTLIQWKPSALRPMWPRCSPPSGSPPPTGFSPSRARACPVLRWIGPTVEDTLTALRQEGHSAVVIQPIGFLCDHVEILYDIDIGFRDFAAGIGLEVVRPQSLNDSPLLTATLEDLARQGFARLAGDRLSRSPVAAL